MITNRFSPNYPVSCAQGRLGELIIVQGNGVRPARWDGTGAARDAGVDAPSLPCDVAYSALPAGVDASDLPHPIKPQPGPQEVPETASTRGRITIDPAKNYYVARTDVYDAGNVYYSPPEVSYSTDAPISNGRGRKAKAQSFLNQSAVSEIRVLDGGKYYPSAPSVTLSDSHGKGALLTAILDAPDIIETPGNSVDTGLTGYRIISNGPWPDESSLSVYQQTRYPFYAYVDIPIESNGSFSVAGSWPFIQVQGTITGKTAGTGAVLRVNGGGVIWGGLENGNWPATYAASAVPIDYGEGYAESDDIQIRIHAYYWFDPSIGIMRFYNAPAKKDIVIRAFSGQNPDNPGVTPYAVRSIRIDSRGSGYLVAPALNIVSNTGFGAYATCTVKDGKIDTVTLENSGGGYTTPPKVEILSGGAEGFAVARPHLRGTYQCYFRYVDDTTEDSGGPVPSNLSPVAEVDCGEAATSLTWNVPMPTGRGKKVELWRSTSNQALTLYRVATVTGQFLDDLTDEELRDPDREQYAAMPIVLPNGELNANRFGVPPDDKAVVVRFQDRHFYGVDTSGEELNSIFFSEVDEPESVPPENEIVLQQNARDADSVRAIIPYGNTLLVMQARHAYSLTFSKQPLLDAQVTPIGYRGCLNQRCWEIHDGVCYVLDQYGIYSVTPQGAIQAISDQIENLFREAIDFSTARWNFVTVDPKHQVLRAFVAFKEDSSQGYPTAALCYSLDSKTWWVERYPARVTCGTNVRMSNSDFRCVYGGTAGAYLLDEGRSDLGRGSVIFVTLTNPGAGYKKPPKVSADGGTGAHIESSIDSEGRLTALWITSPGYGYVAGDLFISPPDDSDHPAPVQAAGTFVASSEDADTPMFPTYRYKGGNSPYPTDNDDQRLGGDINRSISLTYQPLESSCEVSLLTYYNNARHPRYNVAFRDRGTGFEHTTVDPAARLDMAANTQEYVVDSGVATAMFSGRSLGDIRSTDRHIAVELVGASKDATPVTFYELDVMGAGGD